MARKSGASFTRRLVVYLTPDQAVAVDRHARTRLRPPAAWARDRLIEAVARESGEIPAFAPLVPRMVHHQTNKRRRIRQTEASVA